MASRLAFRLFLLCALSLFGGLRGFFFVVEVDLLAFST